MDCEHYRLPIGHINISDIESHYVGLMLYNLTIQPTNLGPNGTYGNFEYCAGDQRGSMVGFWIAVGEHTNNFHVLFQIKDYFRRWPYHWSSLASTRHHAIKPSKMVVF